MRFFERKYESSKVRKNQAGKIALAHGLPRPLHDLPSGDHSYEKRFVIQRMSGYRMVVDSVDTYRIVSKEKKRLVEKCKKPGIRPVFKGDYVTLNSLPRRNVIQEEIVGVASRNGVKTIQKRSFFDILDYISLRRHGDDATG